MDVDYLLLVWDTENNKRLEIEDIVDLLNEQQATINEYKENWDDLVGEASEISKRNIELVEENAKLERQLRKAMVYIVSDVCSLSEKKLAEVIEEIKNA